MDSAKVRVVVLTGGPCGGKTSCISILTDVFENMGWKVFRVPETATLLFSGGVVFSELNAAQTYNFQRDLLKTMMTIENTYIGLAKQNAEEGKKTVVICDRGAMDPSAYTDSATWHKILSELNLDEVDIRDNRYDCVVHLVTAAKGAEQFYTLENNSARTEGLELARTLDDAVMKAWMGHSSLQVVDNFSVKNFQEKKNRVVQAVLSRLGLTEHTVSGQIKKYKYVVRGYKYEDKDFPVDYRDFNVEHTYLIDTRSDGSQIRVRRREEANSSIVHLNVVTRHAEIDGQRIETRRTLAQREYDFLRTQADPTRHTVGKHRRCFLWKDRSFQLDTFLKPHPGLVLLETYLESDTLSTINGNGEESMIPPWLDVVEVTNDKKYSMYELSKKDN